MSEPADKAPSESFTPESEIGQKFPGSFKGSVKDAKRLDDRLNGNLMNVAEMVSGAFSDIEKKVAKQPIPIEFDRIHGAGAFGVILGGKVNGVPTEDKLAIRVVVSNELTDHPTLVHPLVLEALTREKHEQEGVWVATVPFSADLPKKDGKMTKEGIHAIATAISTLEATGQLDHFRDPDPSQFGMLMNPKTNEPFRYSDGTLMAFVRDRNAAFTAPALIKGVDALGELKALLTNIRAEHEVIDLERTQALKNLVEAGGAQMAVINKLSKEFNIQSHVPTQQEGHSATAVADVGHDGPKRG